MWKKVTSPSSACNIWCLTDVEPNNPPLPPPRGTKCPTMMHYTSPVARAVWSDYIETQPSCAMRIKLRQQLWLGKQRRLPPAVMTLSVPRLAVKACITSSKVEADAGRLFSRCHVLFSTNQLYKLSAKKCTREAGHISAVVAWQCAYLFSSVLIEDLFIIFLWMCFCIVSPVVAAFCARQIVRLRLILCVVSGPPAGASKYTITTQIHAYWTSCPLFRCLPGSQRGAGNCH